MSLHLPSTYVFNRLQDYFETKRYGGINFSRIIETLPSHMEGIWFVGFWQGLKGNFKADITENNDETKVKLNVNAGNINLLALVGFVVGLPFLMIPSIFFMGLMFCGFSVGIFFAGQWRRSNILREINGIFLNISETAEILKKHHEKVIIKDEEYERKTIEITETLDGFNVNLPNKDVFNQLVDYYGADNLKKKVSFSHIEGKWGGGPFKIDITPSNGKSLMKLDFSSLYINLLVVLLFVVSVVGLLFLSIGNDFGRTMVMIGSFGVPELILSLWMKRNAERSFKALFR